MKIPSSMGSMNHKLGSLGVFGNLKSNQDFMECNCESKGEAETRVLWGFLKYRRFLSPPKDRAVFLHSSECKRPHKDCSSIFLYHGKSKATK